MIDFLSISPRRTGRLRMACMGSAAILCIIGLPAASQEIHFDTGLTPKPSQVQRVTLETESVTVEPGKPDWIELRFRIAPGLHINSHLPKDETLIPTTFQAEPSSGLRLLHTEFPAGIPFRLTVGTGEVLSTYQNELHLRLELEVVAKGDTVLAGKLHYQACDSASCFPPRDLPVQLPIHAR